MIIYLYIKKKGVTMKYFVFILILLILIVGCDDGVSQCQQSGHSLEVCLNTLAR